MSPLFITLQPDARQQGESNLQVFSPILRLTHLENWLLIDLGFLMLDAGLDGQILVVISRKCCPVAKYIGSQLLFTNVTLRLFFSNMCLHAEEFQSCNMGKVKMVCIKLATGDLCSTNHGRLRIPMGSIWPELLPLVFLWGGYLTWEWRDIVHVPLTNEAQACNFSWPNPPSICVDTP